MRELGLSLTYKWRRNQYPGLEAAFQILRGAWPMFEVLQDIVTEDIKLATGEVPGPVDSRVIIRPRRLVDENLWLRAARPRPDIFQAQAEELDFSHVSSSSTCSSHFPAM